MFNGAWDLVPDVKLYEDETGNRHALSRGCPNVAGSSLTTTSVQEHLGAHGPKFTCNTKPCQDLISDRGLARLHTMLFSWAMLKSWGRDTNTAMQDLRILSNALEAQVVMPESERTGLTAHHEYVRAQLEENTRKVLTKAKGLAHRDKVDTYLKGEIEKLTYYQELLERLGHEPETLGLLVGSKDKRLGMVSVLYPMLYGRHHGEQYAVVAPMGVLAQVADLTPVTEKDRIVTRNQVVVLPEGYDHELEDLIVGLYDPAGQGPLRLLQEVVKVARDLKTSGPRT